MPVAQGPPPKNCPICREMIWSREDRTTLRVAWSRYKLHVHTIHPEYEGWDRRLSWIYVVGILLSLLPLSLLATQVASADLARFLALLALALLVVVIATVSLIRQRGKRRFRELWNQEHGAPMNPM
jgi:hypothetical protein